MLRAGHPRPRIVFMTVDGVPGTPRDVPEPRRKRPTHGARARGAAALAVVLLAATSACSDSAQGSRATPSASTSSRTGVASSKAIDESGWPEKATGTLKVVGLGDSVLTPPNCGCVDPVTQYGKALSSALHRDVDSTNLATGGSTAADLAKLLADDQKARSAVAAADVAVVVAGANDVAGLASRWQSCAASCWSGPVSTMSTALGTALDEVSQLRNGRPTRVLVATYWNVVTGGQVAVRDRGTQGLAWSRQLTATVNQQIDNQADAHGDRVVDLVQVFRGDGTDDPTSLLASDGDHPNNAGIRAMVKAFVAATA